jgi:hypothetical protein
MVLVKLLHSDKEKLIEAINNLNSFEISEISESKPEKKVTKFGSYYGSQGY